MYLKPKAWEKKTLLIGLWKIAERSTDAVAQPKSALLAKFVYFLRHQCSMKRNRRLRIFKNTNQTPDKWKNAGKGKKNDF